MNMNFRALQLASLCVFSMALLNGARAAELAETDQVFVRAKAGPSNFSKMDPVDSAFGLGLDLGFRNNSGFGIAGIARKTLKGDFTSYSSTPGAGYSASSEAQFFGISPTYSVTKGIATVTFGLGIGIYSVNQKFVTGNASLSQAPSVTTSKTAIIPNVNIDFSLGNSVFLNIGIDYIMAMGSKPHYAQFSPMGGIGIQF